MKFEVYRIAVLPSSNHSHNTDRSECWTILKDDVFSNLEEAKAYIREKSRVHTDMISITLYPLQKDPELRRKFIDDFCFDDDKYLVYRRFFLGPPPVKEIKRRMALG